ncbi:MAG: IPT/TIG domain-containing protein [Planctomycetota bacterium]
MRTSHLKSAALLLAAALPAQTFTYPDFSDTAGLALLGDAVAANGVLRLTDAVSDQASWVWRDAQVLVDNGFETSFSFRITPPVAGTRAEGLAFVIHDDPMGADAMAGRSWGLGYGPGFSPTNNGLRRCLAIELDTYQDFFLGDTSSNELSVHTRGSQGNNEHEQWSLARHTPAASLSDGQVHALRIVYTPGLLEVFVDNAATPDISCAYDLAAGGTYADGQPAPGLGLADHQAWVGLCSTTGLGVSERVEILDWAMTSTLLTDDCYAGTLGVDTLTVDGSAGGVERVVGLRAWHPFTIALADPPEFGPGAPYVLFLSLLPQPGAFGTNLGFGSTCFPVLPTGAAELVLVDTIGVFPALLPGTATPFSLTLPFDTVRAPLSFTLQAVTFASLAPLQFGITNAVDVAFDAALAPSLNQVTPLSAAPGGNVRLNGGSFLPGAVVLVNGVPVTVTSASVYTQDFAYPAGLPCDSTVQVVNPDGQASLVRPLNPTPTVTGVVPTNGPAAGNTMVFVSGSGFAPGTTVTVGGVSVPVLGAASSTVWFRTPAGTPGQQPIVITTPGGCTVSTSFTYQ